jgi:hypothetical protein
MGDALKMADVALLRKRAREYADSCLKIAWEAIDLLNKSNDFIWEDYVKINQLYGKDGLIAVETAKQMDLGSLKVAMRDAVVNNILYFALLELGIASENHEQIREIIKHDPEFLESFLKIRDSKKRVNMLAQFLATKAATIDLSRETFPESQRDIKNNANDAIVKNEVAGTGEIITPSGENEILVDEGTSVQKFVESVRSYEIEKQEKTWIEPDIVIFAVEKVEILTRDITRISNIIESLLTNFQQDKRFAKLLKFTISGYEFDQRELFEIPEVTGWVKVLDTAYPYIAYWLIPETINWYVFSLVPPIGKSSDGPGRLKVEPDRLNMAVWLMTLYAEGNAKVESLIGKDLADQRIAEATNRIKNGINFYSNALNEDAVGPIGLSSFGSAGFPGDFISPETRLLADERERVDTVPMYLFKPKVNRSYLGLIIPGAMVLGSLILGLLSSPVVIINEISPRFAFFTFIFICIGSGLILGGLFRMRKLRKNS